MPIRTIGLAARNSSGILHEYQFCRRDLGLEDVHIRILACGMCHSDLHLLKGEWSQMSIYPMVPGHEIVGNVVDVGLSVTRFRQGHRVGVSVFCENNCGECDNCQKGCHQYCSRTILTYSDRLLDGTPTQGGYARDIVVNERFVIDFPESLDIYAAAPLLCAGITIWSPMKHFGMDKPGKRIGVIGLGGLGHMAVLFSLAFNNIVVVISRSPRKHLESINILGETFFIDSSDPLQIEASRESLDYIIDTASAKTETDVYLSLLKPDGIFVVVGLPPDGTSLKISPMSLVWKRKRIAGSCVGGIQEIQEMLTFCAERQITAVVEKVQVCDANIALERLSKSDVKYRFVLDVKHGFK